MKTKRMGRTGLKVSEICLGTMTFGHQCDEPTSFAIMDRAAELGSPSQNYKQMTFHNTEARFSLNQLRAGPIGQECDH